MQKTLWPRALGHRRFRATDSETGEIEAAETEAAAEASVGDEAQSIGRRLRRFWLLTKVEVTDAARESKEVVTGERDWRLRRQLSASDSSLVTRGSSGAGDDVVDEAAEPSASSGGQRQQGNRGKVSRWWTATSRLLSAGGSPEFEALNCESSWSLCSQQQKQQQQQQQQQQQSKTPISKRVSLPIWKRPLSWLDGLRQKRASLDYQ